MRPGVLHGCLCMYPVAPSLEMLDHREAAQGGAGRVERAARWLMGLIS